jgi:hypothetical protein
MKKWLFICVTPTSPKWQLDLNSPQDTEVTLVGWRTPESAIDSGVPTSVADLFARTLTTVSNVSFPSSDRSAIPESPQLRSTPVPASVFARTMAKFKAEPGQVDLISTTDPNLAGKLFDDAGFPWHLQGQVALLFPLDAKPPQLTRKELMSVLDRGWRELQDRVKFPHLLGLMRPGVDGDVAGIWSFDKAFTKALLHQLEMEAHRMGFECQLVSENLFAESIAS